MPAAASHLPPLREGVLAEIAAGGHTRHFPAQTMLVHEGDTSDTLFVLLTGRVKVYATHTSGRDIVLRTLGPGEIFGEMAFDGGARSASVVTMEPSTCAVVSGARLREFIGAHPDFALHLIRHLMQRVRSLTDSVKSLALDDVYSRVAALLQQLAHEEGGVRVVTEPLTQQDIAERVGSSREMVSRIFKDLTIGGYIEVKRGRITLLKTLPSGW